MLVLLIFISFSGFRLISSYLAGKTTTARPTSTTEETIKGKVYKVVEAKKTQKGISTNLSEFVYRGIQIEH